jgi:hypothetical protein
VSEELFQKRFLSAEHSPFLCVWRGGGSYSGRAAGTGRGSVPVKPSTIDALFALKVHKHDNFYGSDFEFLTFYG